MKIVRSMSCEDFQKLHVAVGWKILKDEEVDCSLKNSMFISCAVIDDEIVGMARVVGDFASHGLLCDVIVNPKYQKQGIGRQIINDISMQIQAFVNERDEFMLELLPTTGNIEFYKKCGFKYKPESMEGVYKWFKNQKIYGEDCKKHLMQLNSKPFHSIKNGSKNIEMRLYDEKRSQIKPNDIIIFINRENGERMWCRVIKLHRFNNFEQLYQNFNKVQLGYEENESSDPKDMEEYYTKEKQSKYGVVGIEIKLMNY